MESCLVVVLKPSTIISKLYSVIICPLFFLHIIWNHVIFKGPLFEYSQDYEGNLPSLQVSANVWTKVSSRLFCVNYCSWEIVDGISLLGLWKYVALPVRLSCFRIFKQCATYNPTYYRNEHIQVHKDTAFYNQCKLGAATTLLKYILEKLFKSIIPVPCGRSRPFDRQSNLNDNLLIGNLTR